MQNSENLKMKPGQEILCPYCKKNSFLKKIPILDGWTKKGEILACASCSAKIADFPNNEELKKTEQENRKALESFLNTKMPEQKLILTSSSDDKSFCKDCIHFIKHPFHDKCSLHNKFVNPMDDCQDFKKK